MFEPKELLNKAKNSKFYLKILNFALSRMIPFNKPHGFKIIEIKDNYVKTTLPYQRNNLNHIKGLHACALATLTEFTSGIVLIMALDPKKYRIILENLNINYHYQGKVNAYAIYQQTEEWLHKKVYQPLEKEPATSITCEVKIYDDKENHLTTGNVRWQIKPWNKVKTEVN